MERHHRQIRPQIGLLTLGLAAALAQAETYRIAPASDTYFRLEVYKTGLMSGKVHLFEFERYEGEWEYVEGKPADWAVKLTIETGSIVLKDDWLSEKDFPKVEREARENMLAVEKYPTMTFQSQTVRPSGEGKYSVEGNLSIRDKPVPTIVEISVKPDGEAFLVNGAAVVKLKDYGLKPPSAFFGAVGTKSEMDASFLVRAVK